jgi:O-antigen/teichoic acid export membrane protein
LLKRPIHHLNQIFQSTFVRNVAVVATGTAGAQAITMAFSPIITRLYGPEAFGILGTFMAILTVVAPVVALSYPVAIVLPRDDRDALGLARLSIYISFGVMLFVSLLFWIGGDRLLIFIGAESLKQYIFFIPLVIPFISLSDISQQWLIRKKQFGVTARIAVAQSLLLNSTKTAVGLFYPIAMALILVTMSGYLLYAGMLCFGVYLISREALPIKHSSLLMLARKYYDFALYRAPQNFINAVSQGLPVLMLAAFFGPVSAGFYTLGKMVMGMPSTLIGKSVGDVFYPRITKAAHNKENLGLLIIQATGWLACIGCVPFGVVIVFGPWLFSTIFGAEWVLAGEYARWLALFFFFNFINKPSVVAVPVLGIQKGLLVYELFSTGGKVVAMMIGFYSYKSDMVAIALFSLIGAVTYIVMILWIIWKARVFVNYEKTSR